MAKVATLLPVSKGVSDAIKAGRHPLTEDWNQPGYLNREEWDRMGSELERVVEARVVGRTIEELERMKIREASIKGTEDALKELQAKHDSVLAGIERMEGERNGLMEENVKLRQSLTEVRVELENIKAGLAPAT